METPNPSGPIDPIDPIAPHTPGGAHEGLQLADPLPEDEVSAGAGHEDDEDAEHAGDESAGRDVDQDVIKGLPESFVTNGDPQHHGVQWGPHGEYDPHEGRL